MPGRNFASPLQSISPHCLCPTTRFSTSPSRCIATAQLIFAAAKLLRSQPQHHTSFPLQCFAPPSLSNAFLLLCESILCRSFSVLIFSRRCPGTAKQSVAAAHLRSSSVRFSFANHSHAYAIQSNLFGSEPLPNQAIAKRCLSSLFPNIAWLFLRTAFHRFSIAAQHFSRRIIAFPLQHGAFRSELIFAFPLRFISMPFLFDTVPFSYWFSSRNVTMPLQNHCISRLYPSKAKPRHAMPSRSGSMHCHAWPQQNILCGSDHGPSRSKSWRLRYAISSQVKRPLPLLRHWPMPLNRP